VLALYRAVGLRVEDSRKPVVYAQVKVHSHPESTCELSGVISDDVVRYAMFANTMVQVEPDKFRRIEIFPSREVDGHLCEPINNDKDARILGCC
jgi:hypothetical protein